MADLEALTALEARLIQHPHAPIDDHVLLFNSIKGRIGAQSGAKIDKNKIS